MGILIISNYNDQTVDCVIDWIIHYKKNPFRLTFEDFIHDFSISTELFNQKTYRTNIFHKKLNLNIESAWLRSETRSDFHSKYFKDSNKIEDAVEIRKYLKYEIITAKQIFLRDNQIRWLTDYKTFTINKFHTLNKARQIGLKIPNTLITNSKSDIINFLKRVKNSELILKSIGENLNLVIQNELSYYQPIQVLTKDSIDNLPDYFMFSLFQNKIVKEFEIRVFYLNGTCYSMSIHSNKIDYRGDYIQSGYNPFELPANIKYKIISLMKSLKLISGSIDLIKEKHSNDYYFLEINPIGQFGFLSSICNYNLEEKMAKYLCYGV